MAKEEGETRRVKIGSLDPNENNPRQTLPSVRRLAKMIRQSEWVQPLQAVKEGRRFRLIAGHCRLEAAKLLNEDAKAAGERTPWPTLPVQIVDADELGLEVINGAENLGRADLNLYERGKLFHGIKKRHGLTYGQIGEKFAVGEMTVGNELRIFEQIAPECADGIAKLADRGMSRREINGILRAMVDGKKSHQEQIAYLEKLTAADAPPPEPKKRKPRKPKDEDEDEVADPIRDFMRELEKLPDSPAKKAAKMTAAFMMGGKRSPLRAIGRL